GTGRIPRPVCCDGCPYCFSPWRNKTPHPADIFFWHSRERVDFLGAIRRPCVQSRAQHKNLPPTGERAMAPGEDISHLIVRLKEGDPAAAQKLWENYYQRLVQFARGKLHGLRRSVADEEDVALSAFASFCRGAERECFPQLSDRTDLWKLLLVITARK